MSRLCLALLLACTASLSHAQTVNRTCGWGVLSNFTKATAGSEHCSRYAGGNGFLPTNPNRAAWIGECTGIVNAAVASCGDNDLACMKPKIQPLQGQVCALNQKYGG